MTGSPSSTVSHAEIIVLMTPLHAMHTPVFADDERNCRRYLLNEVSIYPIVTVFLFASYVAVNVGSGEVAGPLTTLPFDALNRDP